jgi:hypothetical protein
MGKLKKRPIGYSPLLEFTFREKREGGAVLSPGRIAGALDAQARRSCLVLVHGFNNTDGEAALSYDGFRRQLIEAFGATHQALDARLGDTFWAGDADWGWFDFADFGVYSRAIGHAHQAANELVALLERMPNLIEVEFIGHSLGCRVVMETVHHLVAAGGGPRIRRVCLMAAAVPMEKLEPGGDFHPTLMALAANGTEIFVMHSRQDKVLHFAFPFGQAMGGPGERSWRALGREGPNPLMPGYHGTLDEMPMTGADHGDYWGHSGKAIARESAKWAGRFFGLDQRARAIGLVREIGDSEPGFPFRTAFGLD